MSVSFIVCIIYACSMLSLVFCAAIATIDAQNGHGPAVTATQEAELRYQTRRLSNHPSVILFDGCNECLVGATGPTTIYADFVLSVVASEDSSRILWPSSPGDGWKSGVHRLTGLPNGNKLVSGGTHDKIEVRKRLRFSDAL